MWLNRAQQKAVHQLYKGNPDGSPSYWHFRAPGVPADRGAEGRHAPLLWHGGWCRAGRIHAQLTNGPASAGFLLVVVTKRPIQ
jgi:hypothetical protein